MYFQNLFFPLIGNLEILKLLKLLIVSNIQYDVMKVASTFLNISKHITHQNFLVFFVNIGLMMVH